jgi:oxygen-independent coproporphyrinogen-3 oxidase
MFSLYVHIPYCRRKCPYCDFNSYGGPSWPEHPYTEALLREIAHAGTTTPWAGEGIETVFFGGGTPSLFAPASVGRVLAGVSDWFHLSPDVEITLEANPGTVGPDALVEFRSIGVNRVSFGVQSFHDRHLTMLGRVHNAETARNAIELARAVGFRSINADLIFGIPGQSGDDWRADLEATIDLAAEHIAAYGLTYEEGTLFHAWRSAETIRPASEDEEADMFTEAARVLTRAGYEHYEISNYALPGHTCRHNLTYWRRRMYLGIGAGAHSFAPAPSHGVRFANARPPQQYMDLVDQKGHAVVSNERLDREEAIGEFLFLGLRLLEGIDRDGFVELFGVPPEEARPALGWLVEAGLLERGKTRIRLTTKGLLQADSVFASLL